MGSDLEEGFDKIWQSLAVACRDGNRLAAHAAAEDLARAMGTSPGPIKLACRRWVKFPPTRAHFADALADDGEMADLHEICELAF